MFINLTKTEVEETVTALEETKWIPCNERMPKGTVLCCDDRGEMLVGLLCKVEAGYGIFQGIYEHTAKTIVAWMPLPELYKGE